MDNNQDTGPRTYGIEELAALGGVSRRTVRYYVQRGLLPAPTGVGRGRHYTGDHLARLVQMRTWQEQGVALAEIEARLAGRQRPEPAGGEAPRVRSAELWSRYLLADGVELHVRSDLGLGSGRLGTIANALKELLGKPERR